MQVNFRSPDAEAARLRSQAEHRVRFATRRLAWGVPRANVQLADVNGPRGGLDKLCRVELATDGRGTVVATALGYDWLAALDQALGRAVRGLVRLGQRERRLSRSRHPFIQPS